MLNTIKLLSNNFKIRTLEYATKFYLWPTLFYIVIVKVSIVCVSLVLKLRNSKSRLNYKFDIG